MFETKDAIVMLLLMVALSAVLWFIFWRSFENSRDPDIGADHACHPGIAIENLRDNRSLCTGGNGEYWVVKIK